MHRSLDIDARSHWNDTGIDVTAGQGLRIIASGTWSDWKIETDADGFAAPHLKLAEPFRRAPSANWFQLCGAVDRRLDQVVRLGRDVTFSAPASGRLFLFANDVSWMHWNNASHLTVQILTAEDAEPRTRRLKVVAGTALPSPTHSD
jgi:hypothetical protein